MDANVPRRKIRKEAIPWRGFRIELVERVVEPFFAWHERRAKEREARNSPILINEDNLDTQDSVKTGGEPGGHYEEYAGGEHGAPESVGGSSHVAFRGNGLRAPDLPRPFDPFPQLHKDGGIRVSKAEDDEDGEAEVEVKDALDPEWTREHIVNSFYLMPVIPSGCNQWVYFFPWRKKYWMVVENYSLTMARPALQRILELLKEDEEVSVMGKFDQTVFNARRDIAPPKPEKEKVLVFSSCKYLYKDAALAPGRERYYRCWCCPENPHDIEGEGASRQKISKEMREERKDWKVRRCYPSIHGRPDECPFRHPQQWSESIPIGSPDTLQLIFDPTLPESPEGPVEEETKEGNQGEK